MDNYSVTFSICGYYFKIVTHDCRILQTQVENIRKFYTGSFIKEEDNVLITAQVEYIEDYSSYSMLSKDIQKYPENVVQSFKSTCWFMHKKNDKEFYCQIGKKCFIIKNNDNSYIVVGTKLKEASEYPIEIIKEVFLRKQEENGKIFMSSTGITIDGNGIALLENGELGKTAFLTDVLNSIKVDIISSERIFLYQKKEQFIMDYFPMPVLYDFNTVYHSHLLKEAILEKEEYPLSQIFWEGKGKLKIPLTDMPSIFGNCEIKECARLNIVLFISYNIDWRDRFVLKKMSKDETILALMQACSTPIDYETKHKQWIYLRKLSETDIEKNKNRVIINIANSVKGYHLLIGKKANIKEIIEDILK